jgi:hypothetical protein
VLRTRPAAAPTRSHVAGSGVYGVAPGAEGPVMDLSPLGVFAFLDELNGMQTGELARKVSSPRASR